MTFINEYLSEDDYKKYIDPYKARSGVKSLPVRRWTVDRERESFLTLTHTVREDMYEGDYSITYWLFLWEGEYITFVQHRPAIRKLYDHYFKATNIIKKIDLPESLTSRKEELFTILKEAMVVNRGSGVVGSQKKKCEITLELSEVHYAK